MTKFTQTAKEALKCIALASLSLCLLGGFVLIERAPAIIHAEAEATRTMVAAQTAVAIGDANNRLADALTKADSRLTGALSEIHLASVNADRRTGEALNIVRLGMADVGVTLANAETDLNHLARDTNTQMGTLNATAAATLKPVGETAQQLDDAAPLWLDCGFNPDCAFNRYQGVAKAVEKTAVVIAAAAPSMADSADKIAASSVDTSAAVAATGKEVAIAARRFNSPQTKWQAFRMWLLTVARIAGDF